MVKDALRIILVIIGIIIICYMWEIVITIVNNESWSNLGVRGLICISPALLISVIAWLFL